MKNRSSTGPGAAERASTAAYRKADVPVEERVGDLLARMTLEEKAAQMLCVWQQKAATLVDADGNFDLEKARAAFEKGHGLGQVGRPSDAGKGKDARSMAELTNAIQAFFQQAGTAGIWPLCRFLQLAGLAPFVAAS